MLNNTNKPAPDANNQIQTPSTKANINTNIKPTQQSQTIFSYQNQYQ